MTTKHYERPSLADVVDGETGLPNRTKFTDLQATLPKEPLEGFQMDADINTAFDALNELYDTAISGAVPDNSVTLAKLAHLVAGSMYYMDASGVPSELALGSNGQVLSSNGTIPSWVSPVATPTGSVIDFAGSVAPSGFLLADGAEVSRATYSDLFAVIGTTYGSGDGSTTFDLPDLRGRTSIGQDDMGGTSADRITDANADTLGGAGGNEDQVATVTTTTTGTVAGHTLTESEIPSHTHVQNAEGSSSNIVNLVIAGGGVQSSTSITGTAGVGGTNITTDSAGGGGSHDHTWSGTSTSTFNTATSANTQPWLAMNKIIKT